MYTFTIPREKFDEENPNKQIIRQLISKHISIVEHLKKNMHYYQGKHKILNEDRENKLICNHAKDISDTASSYFIGNPVSYKAETDISDFTDALETAGADETDGDNGLELSIYGLTYEYIYTKEGESYLTTKNLSAENTFMVKDDSIEENELFAVYYYIKKDDSGAAPDRYIATVLTRSYKYELNIENNSDYQPTTEPAVPHYLEEIPVIEYLNNKLAIGDFELQIPLIDAYNALMSDRVTDKEQFIDAILAIYGTLLADDEIEDENGEKTDGLEQAMKRIKRRKVMEIPEGAKAEYLTRTFDESGVEVLKKAIEQDIHKFSHIPCMTDESFGGNVSGVAMEFKLLGMENITKIKTRYYKKGLRKRICLHEYERKYLDTGVQVGHLIIHSGHDEADSGYIQGGQRNMNDRPLVLVMEEAKNEIAGTVLRVKVQTGLPYSILDGILSSVLADVRKDTCAEIAAAAQSRQEPPEEEQNE